MNKFVLTHEQFSHVARLMLRDGGLDDHVVAKLLERSWPCSGVEAARVAQMRGVQCEAKDIYKFSVRQSDPRPRNPRSDGLPVAKLSGGLLLFWPSDVDELVDDLVAQGRFSAPCKHRMTSNVSAAEAIVDFDAFLAELKQAGSVALPVRAIGAARADGVPTAKRKRRVGKPRPGDGATP